MTTSRVMILTLTNIVSLSSLIVLSANCLAINKPKTGNSNELKYTLDENSIVDQQLSANSELSLRQDFRRPVWNLAHMVNSIKELDYRIGKGANAVEVDVTFSKDGDPLFTYHGPPCDCWRHCHQQENFDEYLRYINEISMTDPNGIGQNLTLLFLDLKLDYLDQRAKARGGQQLARSVLANLYSPDVFGVASSGSNQSSSTTSNLPKRELIRLILSVNHVNDFELVNNFIHYMDQDFFASSTKLMQYIGFDVGMNDDIQHIESMWKKFGKQLNLWQGDGYTNCFSPFYNLERLSKALGKRDQELGYPSKVYQWTIDLHDRMRESLRMGVDAVMTNHPERLITVINEPEMAGYFRLANRDDEPFRKIVNKGSSRSLRGGVESARYQRSASSSQPSRGGFIESIYDVLTSWFAYIREIPMLSLPTTSRFLPKTKRLNNYRAASAVTTTTIIKPRTSTSTTTTTTTTTMAPIIEARNDNSSQSEQTSSTTTTTSTTQSPETTTWASLLNNDGPKWYTSAISNFLVSMLKLVMPVQSGQNSSSSSSTSSSSDTNATTTTSSP